MKKIYTCLALILLSSGVFAQQTLTLEDAIQIALDNNIDIKRAKNNAIGAKANLLQSKLNFLPSLSASAGHRWGEGLNFDQTSGGLVNTTTLSGSGSINANMTIFNGFSNALGKKRSKALYQAAEESVKGSIQATEASVVGGFLNVVSTKESLKIAEQTRGLLLEQLEREEKRERAGVGNMEQVYNFKSQVAQQDLTIIGLKNNLATSRLTLIQLLLLNPADNYEFAGITVNDAELENSIEEYNAVYTKSMAYAPSIKSAEFNLEAASKSLKISEFAWLPSLSLGASIGTNWSSNVKARDANGDIIRPLRVENLSTQFESNVSKGAGLTLSIPLFTRFQNRNQVQQSKIQMLNSQLGLEQAKNTLTNQVQQAYLNLTNAKTTYAAAKASLENLNTSYEFAKTRYENGTIDFVTYLQSLNGKNRGELELVRAKYGIMFRKLILDIFTGELDLPSSN